MYFFPLLPPRPWAVWSTHSIISVLIWPFVNILATHPPETSQSNILCHTITNMDEWWGLAMHYNLFTQSKNWEHGLDGTNISTYVVWILIGFYFKQNTAKAASVLLLFASISSIKSDFLHSASLLSPQARRNWNMCSIAPTVWGSFGCQKRNARRIPPFWCQAFTQFMIHSRGKYCELTHLFCVTENPTHPFLHTLTVHAHTTAIHE